MWTTCLQEWQFLYRQATFFVVPFTPLFSLQLPTSHCSDFFQILSSILRYLITNVFHFFFIFFVLPLIICVDSPWISIRNESEIWSAVTYTKFVKKWLFSGLLVLDDSVGGFLSPARCHWHYFFEADTSLIIH